MVRFLISSRTAWSLLEGVNTFKISPITIDTAGIRTPEIMAPKTPIVRNTFSFPVMYLKKVLIAMV
jgi:hypothetical protein